MKTIALATLLASFVIATTSVRATAPEGWTEDYAKALEQAKTEHKKVLLDFTGSDWCTWCKKIDAEVFETQKFKDYAAKHLVLVKVDFPRGTPQSDEIKSQNAKLKEKHKVSGFPTLMVVSSSGQKTWEHVGYLAGGPDAFIKALGKK